MIPTTAGICGFVHLSGNFNGIGESARITSYTDGLGQTWWQLKAQNTVGGTGSVRATARCMAWDQRQRC